MTYTPVILTGGAGSRLWPVSREHYPKPLLPMLGDKTLLQETALRLKSLADIDAPVFVCNEEHRFLVAEQVQALGMRSGAIMLEPVGRNTAPALTVAALRLVESDAASHLMVVMPADHVIPDEKTFISAVEAGAGLAEQGKLVTFGIVPTKPVTGYGYIRRGTDLGNQSAFEVDRFVEKPDQATAEAYLSTGDYYWNSGIFLMRADRWVEEIGQFRPDILEACQQAVKEAKHDIDFTRLDKVAFENCPSDSIDYAVMEKTASAVVLPLDAGWSDVGCWSSMWDVSDSDQDGNVIKGDVLTHDTANSLIISENRCIAAVGIKDMIIVETSDAILVAEKGRSQDVKKIVNQLKADGRDEYLCHRKVYRPWGNYEGIDCGQRYQVKRLTVNPGAKLSLQMHHHRAEHWVVVTGTARVTRGEDEFILSENESTYIPLGTNHRLENPGSIPLEIIEVQSGSYLGEDDIVRFEDVYNRVE